MEKHSLGRLQQKRGRGRPSAFHAGRCDEIITIMREGFSIAAAAGAMGVHRDTIYDWARRYPDFSDALQRAKCLRVLKLETDLLATRDAVTVNRCIAALKSADPEEWNKAGLMRRKMARDRCCRIP